MLQALAAELDYDTNGGTKEEIVADILDGQTAEIEAEADTDEDGLYDEDELAALTIAKIKVIAADKGYTITKTLKAEIIAEFLAAQEAAQEAAAEDDT